MNSSPLFKKIWNIISSVLVVIIVLCAVFLMGSRLLGYRVFTVISGSMEPKYSVGDLIYVKQVDPDGIKKGDIITFILNEDLTVATHRVEYVDAENRHFYTKGDANEEEDFIAVPYSDYRGLVIRHFPYLGGWLAMNTTMAGKLTLMAYLACGCLLNILAGKMRG